MSVREADLQKLKWDGSEDSRSGDILDCPILKDLNTGSYYFWDEHYLTHYGPYDSFDKAREYLRIYGDKMETDDLNRRFDEITNAVRKKQYNTEANYLKAIEILLYLVRSTPTDENGNFCPVNQPVTKMAEDFLLRRGILHKKSSVLEKMLKKQEELERGLDE